MHVLLCHPSAELYGSDRMALEAVVGLMENALAVTVVLPEDGPLRSELESVGATVLIHDIPVLRKSALRPMGFARLLFDLLRRGPRMVSLVRQAHADVLYANTIVQPWWALVARCMGKRVVIHVREAEADPPAIIRRLLLLPLRLAHSVIANSQFTASQIYADCPQVKDRTVVVYNGKDWSPYEVPHVAADDGRFRVLFVGRLSPRKGPDLAIRALDALRMEGRNVGLTIAGAVFPGYEWYESELRAMSAASLGGNGAITFTGFVERPHELFAEADVLVVPSRAEPFGTVAAEGLAANVPVIVSDVQGLVEIVRDGREGLVVPSDDPIELASRIGRLMDDPEMRRSLAQEGRRSVNERFSRERYRSEIAAEVSRVARVGRGSRE